MEVIAFVLRYLKDELKRRFSSADFDWVITVPAIWNAGGKQMMREAAYLVRMYMYNFTYYVLVLLLRIQISFNI